MSISQLTGVSPIYSELLCLMAKFAGAVGLPTCLCVACLPCWHRQARRQVEGEQEGESQPEEAGRGKYSPP
ncbi:MAG: hypothetical protein ABID54_03205, partial [Pseudomonadota bacterium]